MNSDSVKPIKHDRKNKEMITHMAELQIQMLMKAIDAKIKHPEKSAKAIASSVVKWPGISQYLPKFTGFDRNWPDSTEKLPHKTTQQNYPTKHLNLNKKLRFAKHSKKL